ncbi:MAG: diaminobutyrate acetyltransferase [Burkholderiaceae bacterium]|jgi:L-2,4-diaminobutyric acid acetyltransferase|nr:diaminobutyrate acetyltransferase [Burkholderiaceae bacterium]
MSAVPDPSFALTITAPGPGHGVAVHDLVAACPPLDRNSLYANLLQCSHFAPTCALALQGDEAVGWVSGYIPPSTPATWFLWQVAIAPSMRGQGLAQRLIADILARPACAGVRFLETTITPDNEASWHLFRGVAKRLGAPLAHETGFDRDRHFGGRHDTEMLVRIGPFAP